MDGQSAAHVDGRLHSHGGTLLARFEDQPTGWLAAWVLRQGPNVEVVAPQSLARWVAAMARRVAEGHG